MFRFGSAGGIGTPGIALLLAALWGACFNPTPQQGLRCSIEGECPYGQVCDLDGYCRRIAGPGDDGQDGADAGSDPGRDGGGADDPLLDTEIRISSTAGDSTLVSLASCPDGYGLAWVEDLGDNTEIYFAKVGLTGAVDQILQVTDAPGAASKPSLVWTGYEFAVAWSDRRDGNTDIYMARIAPNGTLVAADIRITSDDGGSHYPSLAWTGNELALAWSDNRDGTLQIYFARLSASGSVLAGEQLIAATMGSSNDPVLAWNGGAFGLAWSEVGGSTARIVFQRLNAAGIPTGYSTFLSGQDEWAARPSLVWTSTQWALAWDLYATDLDGNGTLDTNAEVAAAVLPGAGDVTASPTVLSAPNDEATGSSLAWTGSEIGVAWQRPRPSGNGWDLVLSRLDGSGVKIGANVKMTNSSSDSFAASLQGSGQSYGVSWSDNRDGNAEIYLRELAPGACETDDQCPAMHACVAFACAEDQD